MNIYEKSFLEVIAENAEKRAQMIKENPAEPIPEEQPKPKKKKSDQKRKPKPQKKQSIDNLMKRLERYC